MLIKFRPVNLRPDSLALVDNCNKIIDRYRSQGLRLTLRQLYYQNVVSNFITNEEKSYKRLSSVISDARLSGLVDWDAIEDRVRVPRRPSEWDDLKDLVESALASYRLPRWDGQENYVELWVEKDALAGVLAPLAREYHVTMMVNRGYSSQSAMYEAAERFIRYAYDGAGFEDLGTPYGDIDGVLRVDQDHDRELVRQPVLLYLGDHDPSGEDMVRDIRERLVMFGVRDIEVRKIALTMDQVKKYAPPPNPAKVTDPRAADYVAKHGNHSWEVDALPPDVLAKIIRAAIEGLVDDEMMDKVKEREARDKGDLTRAVDAIMKKKK